MIDQRRVSYAAVNSNAKCNFLSHLYPQLQVLLASFTSMRESKRRKKVFWSLHLLVYILNILHVAIFDQSHLLVFKGRVHQI